MLTIAVCERPLGKTDDSLYEGVEILTVDKGQDSAEFLRAAIRAAKGKYMLITDGEFRFADIQPFLSAAEKSAADILAFDGGYCFKTALLRGLNIKNIRGRDFTELLATFAAKSVAKTAGKPLNFRNTTGKYSDELQADLTAAVKEFGASKAKLPKNVYTFAFDLTCEKLIQFYMGAMLTMRAQKREPDGLVAFDRALKEQIVLFLALEKRFTAAKLSKLREKQFKISFLTAKKFELALKK